MPGLTASLWMAQQALLTNQGALNVTTNNIANASTPGYTRERAILNEAGSTLEGQLNYGTGVSLEKIQSVRDQVLQLRIAEESQQQSSAQAQYKALQQIQVLFSNPTEGIGADFSAFFNQVSRLSTDPSSIPQRQAVLTAAQNLVSSFNQTESSLNRVQSSLNQSVSATVTQINTLTQQIAKLNLQVGEMQKLNQEPGVLLDQENQLISQLSLLTNISVIQTEAGETITTGNGTALVVGGRSFDLQSSPLSGSQRILAQGQDITDTIQGGTLGGTLQVRDQVIPGMLSQIDNLATDFATTMNTAQQAGFDLNGNPGQPIFSVTAGAGAASSLQVAMTDPSLIAASSDGTPGSNGNLANLMAVESQALSSGSDPIDTYANMVSSVGNLTSQAQTEVNASSATLTQLNDQLGSISGVSIDEETTNLMNYQRAYQAAARVITTIDSLTQTVLQMGAPA